MSSPVFPSPLLFGWQFPGEEPGRALIPVAGQFLPVGCWLHFDYSQETAIAALERLACLHPDVIHALTVPETRPRLMPLAGGFLLYLRGVNLNPGARPEDMVAIRLWVDVANQRVISTQRRQLRSLSEIQTLLLQGRGPANVADLLATLVELLHGHMEDVVDELERRAEDFETLTSAHIGTTGLENLAQLRRQAISLKRYLSPQQEACLRLAQESRLLGEDIRTSHRVREAAERLQRLLEDLDLLREHAAIAREDLQSRLSDRLGRRMYVLAVITAIFLPLSFITGLFGVNLGGIPGAEHTSAFTLFSVGIFLFSLVLLGLLKYRSWL